MSNLRRPFPRPDAMLPEYTDFILSSHLARRALVIPSPPVLANLLRDLIEHIFRLEQSCHLPEFTDHGLSHLCSLVHRISAWTTNPANELLVERITTEEASVLLLATLFHDVGMLSQRPEDLPEADRLSGIPRLDGIADWVRRTHIARMEGLLTRMLKDQYLNEMPDNALIKRAMKVATAHGHWPHEWGELDLVGRDAGLAALLAIVDLLDEDSVRCDTPVMLAHRQGNSLNYAHWLRHALTVERVAIIQGEMHVEFGRLSGTTNQMLPVYAALRNHFRLTHLYREALQEVGVTLSSIQFSPPSGLPQREAEVGDAWTTIRGFSYETALVLHLLRSFMEAALLDDRRLRPELLEKLRSIGLEDVDLSLLRRIPGDVEGRSDDEQVFEILLASGENAP